MKKCKLVFVGLLLFCLPNITWSLTLSDPQLVYNWEEMILSGNPISTADGTTLSFYTGAGQVSRARFFIGATGVLATANLSDSSEDSYLTFEMNLGSSGTSGDALIAMISLQQSSMGYGVFYALYKMNLIKGEVLGVPIQGFLGSLEAGWAEGQDITLGIARVGNEIWYYSSTLNYIVKVLSLDTMGPTYPLVVITAESEIGIEATVSDIRVIYP